VNSSYGFVDYLVCRNSSRRFKGTAAMGGGDGAWTDAAVAEVAARLPRDVYRARASGSPGGAVVDSAVTLLVAFAFEEAAAALRTDGPGPSTQPTLRTPAVTPAAAPSPFPSPGPSPQPTPRTPSVTPAVAPAPFPSRRKPAEATRGAVGADWAPARWGGVEYGLGAAVVVLLAATAAWAAAQKGAVMTSWLGKTAVGPPPSSISTPEPAEVPPREFANAPSGSLGNKPDLKSMGSKL
jgi:hypothetical protein